MPALRKHADNLALVGPMGAGKSALARELARHLRLACVDADAVIEQAACASVREVFEREGEAAFRQREREALATLCAGHGQVIATGGGAVLDAGTRRLLQARCLVLWLQADEATQLERLAGDTARPLLRGDDPAATLRRLADARGPLYAEVADLTVDTSGLSLAAVAERALALVQARWARGQAA